MKQACWLILRIDPLNSQDDLKEKKKKCPGHIYSEIMCMLGANVSTIPAAKLLLLCPTAKSLQSCPTLCNSIDSSPPGSPVPGILQARTPRVGCHFLLQCMEVKSESEVIQSCPTLCNPMDCSLPGSSVHGIFQARVLEWVAIAFSTTIPREV